MPLPQVALSTDTLTRQPSARIEATGQQALEQQRLVGAVILDAARQLVTDPLRMTDTGFAASDPSRVPTAYVSATPEPHALAEGEIVSPFEGAIADLRDAVYGVAELGQ
jgi:hypothetical protein